MSINIPQWNDGHIDYSGTYPRLEASLRNDSARMVRNYKTLSRISMTDVIGKALGKYYSVYTAHASGHPFTLEYQGKLIEVMPPDTLPSDEGAENHPLKVNITDRLAKFMEATVQIDGISISDVTNRAVHLNADMTSLALKGAQVVSHIPPELMQD